MSSRIAPKLLSNSNPATASSKLSSEIWRWDATDTAAQGVSFHGIATVVQTIATTHPS